MASGRHESEAGIGLVELLIALTVTSIGVMALVAGLSSGTVALNRASTSSTAAAVLDKQMEAFRAVPWDAVGLDPDVPDPTVAHYQADAAYTAAPVTTPRQITVRRAETTTTAELDDAQTSLSVSSFAGFPATGQYDIVVQASKTDAARRELMTVTAGNGGTTWTVTRAADAVSHPVGSYVATISYVTGIGCSGADYCQPTRTVTEGAKTFRIDTYVRWTCPVRDIGGTVADPFCSSATVTTTDRPAKLVTIVVRDGNDPSKVLVRQTSTFDASVG